MALALAALVAVPSAGSALDRAGARKPPAKAMRPGIWITAEELRRLPMRGAAWKRLKAIADDSLGTPEIADQDGDHDVRTLAVALVYARTGEARYRVKAAQAILAAIGTEAGGRTLALGRNLLSYVISADLVQLRQFDPAGDGRFRAWLRDVRSRKLPGGHGSLIRNDERGPGNWGRHAGASRVAIAVYLGDRADLARAATVFRGWLGDRSAYTGFVFHEPMTWHADPEKPVGVNPVGAVHEGRSIDGVLPEDMRRGRGFQWPPRHTDYPREGLSGALAEAEILHRQGYDAWNWSNRALLRASQFLYDLSIDPGKHWKWQRKIWHWWVVNYRYRTSFPVSSVDIGKNLAYTDWTHSASRGQRS